MMGKKSRKSGGKSGRSVARRSERKWVRKQNRFRLLQVISSPDVERRITSLEDKHVVDFLAHVRSKAGVPKEAEFPIPLLEFIRHVGGTGLGMSRRFAEGDTIMLPSGHRINSEDMDNYEMWVHLPYVPPENAEKLFLFVDHAMIKPGGTPVFPGLKGVWRRLFGRDISKRKAVREKAIAKLLSKFRQGKTQKDFLLLALKIGQAHAEFRGWKKTHVGTEVPIYVKDSDFGDREIGSRDLFLYGKRSDDGDEYEGISIEIESSFGTPSLKKIMYGLMKSVNVVDPGSSQEAKIHLVHNIVLTPETKMQKKVKQLLKLEAWNKIEHEVDGVFDPEVLVERMGKNKTYLTEVLEHLQKSDIHKGVLDENDLKIIRDTLEDVRKGKNFPENRWDELRNIIKKVHRANLDRLTLDFNVSDEVVKYILGKPVVINNRKISPKYSHFLQFNVLLYFFSRGFKDSIKERALRNMLLNKRNRAKLLNAAMSSKVDESVTLEFEPAIMKEILDNMAKHMRKALENTVFYLTDSRGKEVKKIVIFKKLPEMYRLRPVVITPENKEWLAYMQSLEMHKNVIDNKIEKHEPITDISLKRRKLTPFKPK